MRPPSETKPRPVYTLMLTHREIVACVIALEEVHPRLLRALAAEAKSAIKKLKAVA